MYKSFYKDNFNSSKMHFGGNYFNSPKRIQFMGGETDYEAIIYSNTIYIPDSRDNSNNQLSL